MTLAPPRAIMRGVEPVALRSWMEENGYTPLTLAVALRVSQSTIYRWLNGQAPIPYSVELALRLLEQEGGAPE